ncbi:MAG: FAD-dependent oxidoreductase, partial [Acidobacteriaceae bacterium]|nr:FAD-dependent oxidoreductase [Acidobacteriaceae bacterium]
PHVAVIGGGLAGLAASIALADANCRVSLFERAPRLGGRATSYVLPDDTQIDNCQHVTLRCCTNLDDFYSRVGVSTKIRFYDSLLFADSSGRRARMQPGKLPAPLHLMPSFLTFPLLKWRDKHAIGHAMLRIVFSGGKPKLEKNMTMLDWLRQQRQTAAAIERFWKTVLVSALNEDIDRIDARYGIDLFWKAFLSNSTGFIMGIPSVPLAELYAACGDRISQTGGTVRTRSGVREIAYSGDEVAGVKLDDGAVIKANYYVAAVTFDRLARLFPNAPDSEDLLSGLQQLHVSPITGVHLWFDRSVMSEPFLTSVDQTIQWIFNKGSGAHLQIVISASRTLSELSQQEIAELCVKELTALLPRVREATLLRFVVVRENAATFSPEPGCDRFRPPQRTPIPNLFLAGDWTQTGWPATMESAVRSGYLAAEAILKAEGRPAALVKPDLPPTGLARWFAL